MFLGESYNILHYLEGNFLATSDEGFVIYTYINVCLVLIVHETMKMYITCNTAYYTSDYNWDKTLQFALQYKKKKKKKKKPSVWQAPKTVKIIDLQ